MIEDAELLRRYAEENSEDAFAELVRRRIDLVYSVARRQVGGDAQLAEDVTQKVFADLARKAGALAGRAVLSGWLYRSAQYAATDVVRAERRRRAREQENQIMEKTSVEPGENADWERLRPMLDQVLGELNEADRDAVALRFFEGRAFADIGAALRLTEDAARKRVERALEKLHARLARRGVTSTAAALGVALANQAGVAAPAGLAATVTGAALAGSAVAVGGAVAQVVFMSMAKFQIGVVCALVVAFAGGIALQHRANAPLRQELETLRAKNPPIAQVRAENARLLKSATDVAALRKDTAELDDLRDAADNYRVALQELDLMDARRERTKQAIERLAGNPMQGPVFDGKAVDIPPKTLMRFPVFYPLALRQAGIEGEVVVEVTIDAEGNVREASALRSTVAELEPQAVGAVTQWQFAPAQKDGRPVNARIEVPIRFNRAEFDNMSKTLRVREKAVWF